MKLNKLWAAVALALALVSCKNEPAKDPEQQKMKYPVALSLNGGKSGAMRATEKSNSLSASNPNERAIENLTIVVFTNNNTTNTPIAVEKVITYDKLTKPTDPYQGEFRFEMGMAGTFQLEVIANGYKDDADKDAFIDQFKQGMSYKQFKKIESERALPNNGETGFVMLSAEPKKVTTLANETAHAGTIKLRRLACRFDVFNKLTNELTLTKVTLQNQIYMSYLMTQAAIPPDSDYPESYSANGTWFTPTVVSGGIYSYENPEKGAVTLQLEGEYKGQAWEKTIELRDKDGKYIATQRNHIYRVLLTKGDGTTPGGGDNGGGKDDPTNADKINYVIEVLDWDEDATMDYSENDLLLAEYVNPLEYVAESNIDKAGTNFVTTDMYVCYEVNGYNESGYNVSGRYDFDTAVAKFSHITIDGEAYHLPSIDELKAIIPGKLDDKPGDDLVAIWNRTYGFSQMNVEQKVVVAGKSINCLQDIRAVPADTTSYALRFKGTLIQSAWKYEFKQVNSYRVMRITSRLVADGVTIEDVSKGSFWAQNNSRDIVRIFPFSQFSTSRELNNVWEQKIIKTIEGWNGGYWTSSPIDEHVADRLSLQLIISKNEYGLYDGFHSWAHLGSIRGRYDSRDKKYSVRLFKDTL